MQIYTSLVESCVEELIINVEFLNTFTNKQMFRNRADTAVIGYITSSSAFNTMIFNTSQSL